MKADGMIGFSGVKVCLCPSGGMAPHHLALSRCRLTTDYDSLASMPS